MSSENPMVQFQVPLTVPALRNLQAQVEKIIASLQDGEEVSPTKSLAETGYRCGGCGTTEKLIQWALCPDCYSGTVEDRGRTALTIRKPIGTEGPTARSWRPDEGDREEELRLRLRPSSHAYLVLPNSNRESENAVFIIEGLPEIPPLTETMTFEVKLVPEASPVREHCPPCPRAQFWDGGEQVPCLCDGGEGVAFQCAECKSTIEQEEDVSWRALCGKCRGNPNSSPREDSRPEINVEPTDWGWAQNTQGMIRITGTDRPEIPLSSGVGLILTHDRKILRIRNLPETVEQPGLFHVEQCSTAPDPEKQRERLLQAMNRLGAVQTYLRMALERSKGVGTAIDEVL